MRLARRAGTAVLTAVTAMSLVLAPSTSAGVADGAAPSGPAVRLQGLLTAAPSSGDVAPSGATDGIAVGDSDRPVARISVPTQSPAAAAGEVPAAAATPRYFGSGPWSAIATVASRATKCTGLTAAELRAMMVSPIFKESAGGTTASSAPAPMTLSRYDEWTGVRSGNTNANANYGLYAFRDPSTVYKRAYWHPGVGIWQYDTAGVGAGFTAAERMDVSVIAVDVANGMRDRWCNPAGWISHAAPFTETERRAAAWAPWWYTDNGGCPLCEQAYQEMGPNTSSPFANISTVPMAVAGGASARTCDVAGVGRVGCWYVDPSKAQGASWWATLAPLDGGSPTQAPAPISAPFYVIKQGGYERRYWIRADTGYDSDVTGLRQLGRNDRPKDAQSGSGIAWSPGRGLCDLTANRGVCGPNAAPTGVRTAPLQLGVDYRLTTFDQNGDGLDDVLAYTPGPGADYLMLNTGNGTFRSVLLRQIGGEYTVTAADVDGDGRQDLVFYSAASGALHLWRSRDAGSFALTTRSAPRGVEIHPIDRNGDGRDELLMYGFGTAPDAIWTWGTAGFRGENFVANGKYQVRIGDFDGNGRQDVLWFAPGTAGDVLWMYSISGKRTDIAFTANSRYTVRTGNFDGDGATDILWYLPGAGQSYVWFGAPSAKFSKVVLSIGGHHQPVVVDLPNDGRDDVMWYSPGASPDRWTRWSATRAPVTVPATLAGTQLPFVGRFSAGGGDGILWYGPSAVSDWIWWQ